MHLHTRGSCLGAKAVMLQLQAKGEIGESVKLGTASLWEFSGEWTCGALFFNTMKAWILVGLVWFSDISSVTGGEEGELGKRANGRRHSWLVCQLCKSHAARNEMKWNEMWLHYWAIHTTFTDDGGSALFVGPFCIKFGRSKKLGLIVSSVLFPTFHGGCLCHFLSAMYYYLFKHYSNYLMIGWESVSL